MTPILICVGNQTIDKESLVQALAERDISARFCEENSISKFLDDDLFSLLVHLEPTRDEFVAETIVAQNTPAVVVFTTKPDQEKDLKYYEIGAYVVLNLSNPKLIAAQLYGLLEKRKKQYIRNEIRQTHQHRRFATFGRLFEGLTSELTTPLTYLLHAATILTQELDRLNDGKDTPKFLKADQLANLAKLARGATESTEQLTLTLRDIQNFLRAENAPMLTSINELIDSTINLVYGEMRFTTRLIKEYRQINPVCINRRCVSQIILNVLLDLLVGEDLPDTLQIRTSERDEKVRIEMIRGTEKENMSQNIKMSTYEQLADMCNIELQVEQNKEMLRFELLLNRIKCEK